MHVLIINCFYPPVVDAHAYRWDQIARHWASQGHQVDVITSRLQGAPRRWEHGGVRVKRVGLVARPTMHSPGSAHAPSLLSHWKAALMDALRPLYRKIYWPDAWWHWLPGLLLEVWRRRHVKYDLVISYYPCMGAHFAAGALKRWANNPGQRWVADYGDPFATSSTMPPNNFSLYHRLNFAAERRLAARADALVFTNEATASDHLNMGVCPAEKVHVVPHLVDVERLHAGERATSTAEDSISTDKATTQLLYIGGFHRGIREPEVLFDVVRRLNEDPSREYVLTIYGPANGFDLSPADCPQIRYKGMIARERALDLMREADVLVNVDNMNCVMVPSKIVEYIATGRPLINIRSGGVVHPAVTEFARRGFAFETDADALASTGVAAIAAFIDVHAGSVAPRAMVEAVLEGYTLADVAQAYPRIAHGAGEAVGGRGNRTEPSAGSADDELTHGSGRP